MPDEQDKSIKTILMVFVFALIMYLLWALKSILLPLALALLLAALFQPLILMLRKIKIPNFIIVPFIGIVTLAIIYGIFNIVIQAGSDMSIQQDYLLERLEIKLKIILKWLTGLNIAALKPNELSRTLTEMVNNEFIANVASELAGSISSFTGSFFMFSLYYIVFLAGMANYKRYIEYVGGKENTSLLGQYDKIQKSVIYYMIIKTVISIVTGLSVMGICMLFGIKFPVFWGFLTFILNFIPSIGSTIATLPPTIMGIIQFDTFTEVMLLLLCLAGIQMLLGNIIEPKVMGSALRLNTITVIFGLVFWGYLWGVPGMMLSVPLLNILKLIFEQFPNTRILARIMSYPDKNEPIKSEA